jgi:hypothetical protein
MVTSVEASAASSPIVATLTKRYGVTESRLIRTPDECERLLRTHRGHVRVVKGDELVGERWCSDRKWYWSMNREHFK